MYGTGHNGQDLRLLIERIERLEEEKKEIQEHIKDVYGEAKSRGYDPKIMRQIIRLRKMSVTERDEEEALLDIYKASLGMLGGTPLGEAAIKKLSKKDPDPSPEESEQEPDADKTEEEDVAEEPVADESPNLDQARELAKEAALQGKPVTDNPYPARDPRRAAWDEEWCKVSGSDGMELPAAWRRANGQKKNNETEDK